MQENTGNAISDLPPGNILLAVLDWGLGHASRCAALLSQLALENRKIIIAGAGQSLALLKASFPQGVFVELPPYNIHYKWRNMVLNLAQQAPRILYTLVAENRQLQALIKEYQISVVISDGRFGCYSPRIANIWLAHQLHIQYRNKWIARAANAIYHRHLRSCFQKIWIPDFSGEDSLAGQLSIPVPCMECVHIGPLSRYAKKLQHPPSFERSREQASQHQAYKYLALLSGPEPQRSRLEQQLLAVFATVTGKALLVRGVQGGTVIRATSNNLFIVDWLLDDALMAAVQASEIIICRSGYSTLMDLYHWNKPAILIPTPGQTEQEYLAAYWQKKAGIRVIDQKRLADDWNLL